MCPRRDSVPLFPAYLSPECYYFPSCICPIGMRLAGGSTRTHVPTGYFPAFIALPTNNPAGGFVLKPVHCSPTGPLSPTQIGTPDTGSLYTSIRQGATQTPLVKSSATSTRHSESEVNSPKSSRAKVSLTEGDESHNGSNNVCDVGVAENDKVSSHDEDRDDYVADAHGDMPPAVMDPRSVKRKMDRIPIATTAEYVNEGTVLEARQRNERPDIATTFGLDMSEVNPRYSGDGQTLPEELAESHTSVAHLGPSSGSSVIRPSWRKRHSGFSLPDGAESQSYANALLLSSGLHREGITIHILQRTSSGYILQPCGTSAVVRCRFRSKYR